MPRTRKKGPYGRGSVYFVPSRKRWAYAPPRLDDGSRPPTYCRTEEQAREVQRRTMALLDAGNTLARPGATTLTAFLDEWIRDTAPLTLRPSTIRARRTRFAQLAPLIGSLRLAELTTQKIQHAYAQLLAQGYAHSTIASTHACLHRALATAVAHNRLQHNPAAGAAPGAPPRREHTTLTPDQLALIIEHDRGTTWEALWTLFTLTGIRPGEAAALQWRDIDEHASTIHIRHTLENVERTLGPPKTDASFRTIWMHPEITAALARHRARIAEAKLKAPEWHTTYDLVFPSTTGTPLHLTTIRNALQRTCRACNLPTITTHDLRHSFATNNLDSTNEAIVSRILGHASSAITDDIYSHPRPTHQEAAIRHLAERLKSSR